MDKKGFRSLDTMSRDRKVIVPLRKIYGIQAFPLSNIERTHKCKPFWWYGLRMNLLRGLFYFENNII